MASMSTIDKQPGTCMDMYRLLSDKVSDIFMPESHTIHVPVGSGLFLRVCCRSGTVRIWTPIPLPRGVFGPNNMRSSIGVCFFWDRNNEQKQTQMLDLLVKRINSLRENHNYPPL